MMDQPFGGGGSQLTYLATQDYCIVTMCFILRDGRYQISYLYNPQTYLSSSISAFLTSLGSMSHFSVVSVGRINFYINIGAIELDCCCSICNSTPHARFSKPAVDHYLSTLCLKFIPSELLKGFL